MQFLSACDAFRACEETVLRCMCVVVSGRPVYYFMLACRRSLCLDTMSLTPSTSCTGGKHGSHGVFTHCGARIPQAYDKHTKTWGGLEVSLTEHVKVTSLVNVSTWRRRKERRSGLTPRESSQIRATRGQLLWLGTPCLHVDATTGTICEAHWQDERLDCPTFLAKRKLLMLLWWSGTQMPHGQLVQMGRFKEDSSCSLQKLEC